MTNDVGDNLPKEIFIVVEDGVIQDAIETLIDEHGDSIEIISFTHNDDGEPVLAHTRTGVLTMERVEALRTLNLKSDVPDIEPSLAFQRTEGRRYTTGTDSGTLARERILLKGHAVKRALVRTYMVLMTLITIGAIGVITLTYYEFTQPAKRMVDYRVCQFKDDKSGIEINGRREISYLERSFFGIHLRLDKDIDHKVQIDIRGDAITVAGVNKDGTWWNRFADTGERGIMLLPDADFYVFSTKKKAPVVLADSFCH